MSERVSTYRDALLDAATQAIREAANDCDYGAALDDEAPNVARAVLDAVLAVPNPEVERLHTWDGLMSLLDEHWPEDVIPTLPDSEDRDPGPRIVSLLRWVERLTAERNRAEAQLAEARAELDQLRAAADPAKAGQIKTLIQSATRLVRIERDDARKALAEAKKKIEDLSSSATHVRVERSDVESVARTLLSYRLAVKQTGIRRGAPDRREAADAALRLIATLDNPPPGDTPEPNRSEP